MNISVLQSKIHRATVTDACLDYVGSITIDSTLLEEAQMQEYQEIQVVNIHTGARFSTYIIAGEADSGMICLNGAAARLAEVGDKVILMTFAQMSPPEAKDYRPHVLFVDDDNRIVTHQRYERHGRL